MSDDLAAPTPEQIRAAGEGLTLWHYAPGPDHTRSPLESMLAGDRVFAIVGPHDGPRKVGDPVTVIPMVVGTPPAPVPPTRWRRFVAWVRRRPLEPTGEFTIEFKPHGGGYHAPPTQPPAC